jgi:hypothetical protein
MTLPLIDRPPSRREVEKLRLILSVFQDGTGQNMKKDGTTVPGGRDFERAVALAFGGKAQENKAIFDVLLPDPIRRGVTYGISCKMSNLSQVDRHSRVLLEVSNANSAFWAALGRKSITLENYRNYPQLVGDILINLVKQWHADVSIGKGGSVDLTRSYYLALSWNTAGWYQLYQFPLRLPEPASLQWEFPPNEKRLVDKEEQSQRLEWYGESGGQLKYYPSVTEAIWVSDRFQLEPLPPSNTPYGLLQKVSAYFPHQWQDINVE